MAVWCGARGQRQRVEHQECIGNWTLTHIHAFIHTHIHAYKERTHAHTHTHTQLSQGRLVRHHNYIYPRFREGIVFFNLVSSLFYSISSCFDMHFFFCFVFFPLYLLLRLGQQFQGDTFSLLVTKVTESGDIICQSKISGAPICFRVERLPNSGPFG